MNKEMKKTNNIGHQKGIGLIELLLSISIIAVLVIGAIVLFKTANESNKAQEISKGYATMSAALHGLFGQQPNYGVSGADLGATLALSGGLPNNMVNNGTIVTPYGAVTAAVAANPRQFTITYAINTIPVAVCSKFVPNLIGTVRSISVGAVVATPAQIITACAAAPVNGTTSNAITITSD